MLYSQDRELEDFIVELLVKSNHTVKSIHKAVSPKLPKTVTLRAIYKSVNKLIDANVLLKVGKNVMLNKEWAHITKLGLSNETQLPLLTPNEKITYTLSSMFHIDTYWKTIISQIYEENGYPAFFYNPHDIWIYVPGRKESEDAYYKSFADMKQYAFFSIGGVSNSDKHFKKTYQNDYLQIDLSESKHFNRNENLTVLGNYVITVSLPTKSTAKIDSLYKQERSEKEMLCKMKEIAQKPQKIKITVEHNQNKAKKLRKKMSKNFFIPKEIKEKFNLF